MKVCGRLEKIAKERKVIVGLLILGGQVLIDACFWKLFSTVGLTSFLRALGRC